MSQSRLKKKKIRNADRVWRLYYNYQDETIGLKIEVVRKKKIKEVKWSLIFVFLKGKTIF